MLIFPSKTVKVTSGPMEYAIEIQNLSKSYPGRTALDAVTFSVKKGSVHGFLGPNGAGKSTTMKILSGLITQSSGTFKINGRVGFLPEHPPVYGNMSVKDYLEFVKKITTVSIGKDLNEVLKKTGLAHVQDRLIGNLSKGYQQRVGIAQALVGDADIIILDEPTVGLDPVAIAEIRELILELKKDHTILFSSHQLYDVELLCSDITLINQGSIMVTGELNEILSGFKTHMTLVAKVSHFSDEIKKALIQKFNLLSIDANKISTHWNLTLKTKGKEDARAEIARELTKAEIGLLEFYEEKAEIEDLFKRMKT
jgi:ABC-2 type transport system ATP-binding protein